MKHLKTWEGYQKCGCSLEGYKDLKVGEIVICVDDEDLSVFGSLKFGEEYIITDIFEQDDQCFCSVEDIKNGKKIAGVYLNRFDRELDYTAKQYNL